MALPGTESGAASPPPGAPAGPTGDGPEAALAHVRHVVSASGSSFTLGMKMLPRPRRQAMYAIYAFCREVDDIADEDSVAEAGVPADKLARLSAWRLEIDRLYAGQPAWPTARALAVPIRDHALPKSEFLAVIDGMEMDAREAMRGPSQEQLQHYCRCVAGAVGLLSIRVFGAYAGGREAAAEAFALALGEALQLTNILRDLDEDAARGRLYLPRELLAACGLAEAEPTAVLNDPALDPVCRELADQARDRFAEADRLLTLCNRRALKPALVMMGIYERILDRLLDRGWHRPGQPLRLSKPEKLWAGIRHGLYRPRWA